MKKFLSNLWSHIKTFLDAVGRAGEPQGMCRGPQQPKEQPEASPANPEPLCSFRQGDNHWVVYGDEPIGQ